MKYIIGVDVGATKIAAGLVYNNQVPKVIKIPTEAHLGKSKIIANIIKVIKIFDNPKIHSIGVGITGQINSREGIVMSSPNLPKNFKNVALAKIIKKEFAKDVFIDNDGHCFALAEAVYGAGKKYEFVVGLTFGTGVGGGIVMNKRVYRGAQGIAGEFCHTTIAENGHPCGCSKRGHLESYASGTGMVSLYKELTGKTKDTFYIENQAIVGEAAAKRVISIMSDALGIGLANIIVSLNPDIIIVGGGLTRVKALWRPALAKARKENPFMVSKKTKIVRATLKEKANILGAALITEK